MVVPNVMGIVCWSPPLDKLGNSVRGIQFCTVRHVERPLIRNLELLFWEKRPWQVELEGTRLISSALVVQDLVELFNFHNYDNLRHFVKKYDPRREGGEQRVRASSPDSSHSASAHG